MSRPTRALRKCGNSLTLPSRASHSLGVASLALALAATTHSACAHRRAVNPEPTSCEGTTQYFSKADITANELSDEQVERVQLFVDRYIKLSRKVQSGAVGVAGAEIVKRENQWFEVVEIDPCTPGLALEVSRRLSHRSGVRTKIVRLHVAFSADRSTLAFEDLGDNQFTLVNRLEHGYSGGELRHVEFRDSEWKLEFGAHARLWVGERSQSRAYERNEKLEGLTAPGTTPRSQD